MGLLGFSPEESLALAAGFLNNRGGDWAQGLGQGILGVQRVRQNATQNQMTQLQLEQMRKQMAEQDQMRQLAQQFQRPGNPGQAPITPNDDNGNPNPAVAPTAPSFDFNGYANALTGIDPMRGLGLQSQIAQLTQKESPFAKIDPKDYTPESMRRYAVSKNVGDLVPYRKPDAPHVFEVKTNGMIYTYERPPGGGEPKLLGKTPQFKPETDKGAEKGVYDSERGVLVDPRTGQTTPVVGTNGQPIGAKIPESAKKELMGLDQEIASIKGAQDAVTKTPSAFGLKRGAATLAGAIPESIAGRFDSEDEKVARGYVFNVVSKAINERAGAAQSAQELARLRSFLPAETDSAAQIDAKLKGYTKYLMDRRGAVPGATPQGGGNANNDPLGLR